MKKLTVNSKLKLATVVLSLWCALVASSCGTEPGHGQDDSGNPTPVPPMATPTVDMDHARQAFQAGGDLTYEEVVALKQEIVGDPDEVFKLRDFDSLLKFTREYDKRQEGFVENLEKCTLKETIGWVAWWWHAYGKDYQDIPEKNWMAVYIYNPFYGFGKELQIHPIDGAPIMEVGYLTDEEAAQLKYGQRVTFSGHLSLDLTLPHGRVTVNNSSYALLDDDLKVPEPTEDELKDLMVVLDRTSCGFGSCPDYTL